LPQLSQNKRVSFFMAHSVVFIYRYLIMHSKGPNWPLICWNISFRF